MECSEFQSPQHTEGSVGGHCGRQRIVDIAAFADNNPPGSRGRNGIDQIVYIKGSSSSYANVAGCGVVVPFCRIAVDKLLVVCARYFSGVVRTLVVQEYGASGQQRTAAEYHSALQICPFVELSPPWDNGRTPQPPRPVAGGELEIVEQRYRPEFGLCVQLRQKIVPRTIPGPVFRDLLDVELDGLVLCAGGCPAVVGYLFRQSPVLPHLGELFRRLVRTFGSMVGACLNPIL